MPLRPLIPDKNAAVRAAIRAVDSKVRPDFRRAIVCAVLAFTLDGAAPYFGGVHTAEVGGGPVQGEGEDRAHDRAAEVGADLRVDGTYRGPYRSVLVRDQWSQRHQPCLSTSWVTGPIDRLGCLRFATSGRTTLGRSAL